MSNNHKNLQKEIDKALNKKNVDKESIIKQSDNYADKIFSNLKNGYTSDLGNIHIKSQKRRIQRITPDYLPVDDIDVKKTLKLFWGINWTSVLLVTCCIVFLIVFYNVLSLNWIRFFMVFLGVFFFLLARIILLSSPYYDVPYYFSSYFEWYEKIWNNTVSRANEKKIWIIGIILYCIAAVITFIPYVSIIIPLIEVVNTLRYWNKNKGYIQLRLLGHKLKKDDIYGIVLFFSISTRILFYIWYFLLLFSNSFYINIVLYTAILLGCFYLLILMITIILLMFLKDNKPY